METLSDFPDERSASSPPSRAHGHPDPMRAHGAWIYLFAAIGAGALVGSERGVEPAMLAGTGFVGAFLVIAALDTGLRRKGRQIVVGASLATLGPLAALGLGAEPVFLKVAALAILPAVAAVVLAKKLGPLLATTLIVGIAALAMAAPVTAIAGGASLQCGAVLFGLLWPFFCWRTLCVAASLPVGVAWDRTALRTRGLREAALAAVWTLVAAMVLRTF